MSDEFPAPSGEILLYTTEDGRTRVECRFEQETLWLSQKLMAELFETTPQNITLHLKALYEEREIDEEAPPQRQRRALSQPRATPWEMPKPRNQSPERAV